MQQNNFIEAITCHRRIHFISQSIIMRFNHTFGFAFTACLLFIHGASAGPTVGSALSTAKQHAVNFSGFLAILVKYPNDQEN